MLTILTCSSPALFLSACADSAHTTLPKNTQTTHSLTWVQEKTWQLAGISTDKQALDLSPTLARLSVQPTLQISKNQLSGQVANHFFATVTLTRQGGFSIPQQMLGMTKMAVQNKEIAQLEQRITHLLSHATYWRLTKTSTPPQLIIGGKAGELRYQPR